MLNKMDVEIFASSMFSCKKSGKCFHSKCLKDFDVKITEIKESEGYVCTETLSITEEDELINSIVKQLTIRDKIINIYKMCLKDLLKYGKSLESERKAFKHKTEKSAQRLKKREKQLKKLSKKIYKVKSVGVEKHCQTDPNFTSFLNDENHQSSLILRINGTDVTDKQNNADKCQCMSEENNSISDREKLVEGSFDVGEMYKEVGNVGYAEDSNKTEHLSESENNQSRDITSDSGWNSSNIKEEVLAVAEEVTNQLGYVFIDEIGMYYDHTSGYYYDDKTSLFYDTKSGTYFYFDHQTNEYTFYAQVSPTEITKEQELSQAKVQKRKVATKREEKEDGECSDSDLEESEKTKEEGIHQPSEDTLHEGCGVDYGEVKIGEVAPSLRLMVMNGELKGSLHIVTLDGGTIGREGDVQVLLKNPSVSKVHAEISYQSDSTSDHHYFIKDLGSSNGTFIKGQRLSEPKVSSTFIELGHGWEVQCGEVVLSCHIHPGLLTCNACEPGLVGGAEKENIKAATRVSRAKLEKERRRQNKALRKKFSLGWTEEQPPTNNPNYKDRSGLRRTTIGSDNPYEKTQTASLETNLTKDNKGFQLMQKMGWSEGQSLGTGAAGITEPIVPTLCIGRTGLGADPSYQESAAAAAESRPKKQNIYTKMEKIIKERYGKATLVGEEKSTTDLSFDSSGS